MTAPTDAQIEAAARAMTECMFAPHELPVEGELWGKYLWTAKAALTAAAEVGLLEKRPFAFRVKRDDEWILFADEKSAQEFAEEIGAEYQGLYVRQTAAAEVGPVDSAMTDFNEALTARRVAEERERCAEVADDYYNTHQSNPADAIRALEDEP